MANLEEQLEACKKELETYKRKTAIMEHALTASAGAYYYKGHRSGQYVSGN